MEHSTPDADEPSLRVRAPKKSKGGWFSGLSEGIQTALLLTAILLGLTLLAVGIWFPGTTLICLVAVGVIIGLGFLYFLHQKRVQKRLRAIRAERLDKSRERSEQLARKMEENRAFRREHIQCETCDNWVKKTDEFCNRCARPFNDQEALAKFLAHQKEVELEERRLALEESRHYDEPEDRGHDTRSITRRLYREEPESNAALVCGILGLFLGPLAPAAIVLGKPGGAGFLLGWVGTIGWILWLMIFLGSA